MPAARSSLAALALLGLLPACGAPPTPETPAPAATTAAPIATTAPGPSSAAPVATAAPGPTATATADAAPASPFVPITELSSESMLFVLGQKGFITDGRHLLSIEGDDVVFDPAMMAGIETRSADMFWRIDQMGGTFPDGAFLSVVLPEGRTGYSQHFQWDHGKWAQKGRSANSESAAGFAAWSEGRTLVLFRGGVVSASRFEVASGKKGGAVPSPTAGNTKDNGLCLTRIAGQVFTALPTGEVMMAGPVCDSEDNAAGVERWAAGQAKGTIDRLPIQGKDVYFDPAGLVARNASDAYVIGNLAGRHARTPYLAHFDGKTWTEEPAPMSVPPAGLWLGPDGVLWTAGGEGLWSRAPGESWKRTSLPGTEHVKTPELSVQSVWPRGPGDVWILAGTSRGTVSLLHTRPATRPVKLPDAEQIAEEVRTRSMPAPLTSGCETPFVLLYTVGKTAPADYDFPTTRAALKGHVEFKGVEIVEVKRLDKRYLGAKVPSVALARKFADFVKQKVQGSTPQTTCYNPKVTRELHLDLATGELGH
ncbi:MAG: hypothetical protein U0359_14960 [Byssovorax sp.]